MFAVHIAYKVTKKVNIPETFVFHSTKPITIGVTDYDRIMIRSYAYGKDFSDKDNFVLQVFLLQRSQDYDFWNNLSKEEYKKEKQRITTEITTEIIKKYNLAPEEIEFLDCWTPKSYTKYFDAYKGSYMSFGITNKIVTSTYPYKCKKIKNLYFASQWQKLFGGLPNALQSGKNCIKCITKKSS